MEQEDYIPRYEYERLESEYRRLQRKYEETEAYKDDLDAGSLLRNFTTALW